MYAEGEGKLPRANTKTVCKFAKRSDLVSVSNDFAKLFVIASHRFPRREFLWFLSILYIDIETLRVLT